MFINNNIKKIYHYTSLDTAIRFILPEMQLRLNPLDNTNDPRENKDFLFNRKKLTNDVIIDQKNNEISVELRKGCKVLCFSYGDNKLGGGGYSYSRMWAHYGGNHQGVCLELDANKFIEENSCNINPTLIRKINYIETDPAFQNYLKDVDDAEILKIGFEEYLKIFRNEHLEFLYFTKFIEWNSEKEIRLLHFGENNKDEYCSIKKSLSRIFLGFDIIKMKEYLPSLKAVSKDKVVFPLEFLDGNMTLNKTVDYLYNSITIQINEY